MGLHGALHLQADFGGAVVAIGVAQMVEPIEALVQGAVAERRQRRAGVDHLGRALGRGAPENHQIEQRIGAESIGAVHRDAGRLAGRHQAGDDTVRIAVFQRHHFAAIVGRDAAHIVMHCRDHRDRLLGGVDAGEDLGGFGDAGQALMQHFGAEMVELEMDMVLKRPDAAALADFQRHRATAHVARRQVLGGRRIALHEALAFRVHQIAAFAARPFGDQHAGAVDAGRVKLDELHILQRQPGAQHHRVAVAGAGMGRSAGEIAAAIAAGGQDHHLGAEQVQRAVVEVPGQHALARAVFVHDQIEGEIFDEELGFVAQ